MARFTRSVFPPRLARLAYFGRILAVDTLFWTLTHWKRSSSPFSDVQLAGFVAGCLFLAIYSTFFIIAPRLRDAGSNPWWAILGLVPFIWPLVHLTLAFIPPKRDVANEPI